MIIANQLCGDQFLVFIRPAATATATVAVATIIMGIIKIIIVTVSK
jgi:hypothetical protein